jgi:hypothetical protein
MLSATDAHQAPAAHAIPQSRAQTEVTFRVRGVNHCVQNIVLSRRVFGTEDEAFSEKAAFMRSMVHVLGVEAGPKRR